MQVLGHQRSCKRTQGVWNAVEGSLVATFGRAAGEREDACKVRCERNNQLHEQARAWAKTSAETSLLCLS